LHSSLLQQACFKDSRMLSLSGPKAEAERSETACASGERRHKLNDA
jgi:hypothetical protein